MHIEVVILYIAYNDACNSGTFHLASKVKGKSNKMIHEQLNERNRAMCINFELGVLVHCSQSHVGACAISGGCTKVRSVPNFSNRWVGRKHPS